LNDRPILGLATILNFSGPMDFDLNWTVSSWCACVFNCFSLVVPS